MSGIFYFYLFFSIYLQNKAKQKTVTEYAKNALQNVYKMIKYIYNIKMEGKIMNNGISAITDKDRLIHILNELRKFDANLYIISCLILLTYEAPKTLYNLKVKEIAPKKEYTSSVGNILTFTPDFRNCILSVAEGKSMEDLIFSRHNGLPRSPEHTAQRFLAFKSKTGISINLSAFQRTFLYNYFITHGYLPEYTPARILRSPQTLLERLSLTKEEYEYISKGNKKESILEDIIGTHKPTVSTINSSSTKNIYKASLFKRTVLKEILNSCETYSPWMLAQSISVLQELEDDIKELKEKCISLQNEPNNM